MRRILLPVSQAKKWMVALWLSALCVFICMQFFPASVSGSSNGPSFVEFESGHVRPIAMSPDGTRLFAVNTPKGTLEVFNLTPTGLALQAEVPVGMEHVAVAASNNNEV